jgi:hypothetical protein
MLEVKSSLPLAAGPAQRLDLRIFLPTQLQVDQRSLPRERLLAGMVTHTRYQVRREGLALLGSDDPENPLVRLASPGISPVVREYEVRMFCNIFHSSLKDELRSAESFSPAVGRARSVVTRFLTVAEDPAMPERIARRATEYLLCTSARRVAHHILALQQTGQPDAEGDGPSTVTAATAVLQEWLDELYEIGRRYDIDPLEEGHRAVMRDSALKKWVQSVLYLDVEESRRNDQVFHVFAGLAAGTAMAFAVAATVFAEQRWAGGSLPWAIALVGAYIVKDRIKEMLRGTLVRLVPGIVQDRVHVVYEGGNGTGGLERAPATARKGQTGTSRRRKIARKVALVRYPDEVRYRDSVGWRSLDLQTRFTLKRRRIRKHRRVDAVVEIVRLDTSDWTTRMDREWKEWPVREADGTLALRRIPRLYKVYVQVTVGVGRGSRDLRRARRLPDDVRTQWYSVTASRDRVSSVKRLDRDPFRDDRE